MEAQNLRESKRERRTSDQEGVKYDSKEKRRSQEG